MNARSRATPPFTSAWILATTSPASAWTRLFSIFVPVASANFLIELSSALFAASEYSFCDSTPIEEPFIDAAASSSSFGTSAGDWGVDVGVPPLPHAARPAAPSTPTPIPRKPRRDHNGLSSMAIRLLRLTSPLHAVAYLANAALVVPSSRVSTSATVGRSHFSAASETFERFSIDFP
jgi:hypothetical protein